MSKKFLDKEGLSHLWDKIKSTFATKEELNGIGGDSSTLIVKAVPILDFSNGVAFSGIASIDKSVAEILTVANAGKNVLLEFDVGINLGIVQYGRLVMALYSDTNLNFDGVFDMSGSGSPSFIRVTGTKYADGDNWTVSMTNLVPQTQLGGLTFTTSNTAPTGVSDNIITFVNEG